MVFHQLLNVIGRTVGILLPDNILNGLRKPFMALWITIMAMEWIIIGL